MRAALVGAMLVCAVGAAVPASADVKAGVDAWQQGDYGRAVAEWKPLAEAGDPDAQFNLGQAYKLGRGVPTDLAVATQWFGKAAGQGHLRAADNYGLLLFQQGRRDDAMPYIRKSADRGEPRAQYILATAMFNGDMVTKDWVKAYALMTRASAAGLEQASTSLGVMDKYIPEDQRKKGLALAAQLASSQESDVADAAAPAPPPAPKPVREKPSRIASAPVPPSSVPVQDSAEKPVEAPAKPAAKPRPKPVEQARAAPVASPAVPRPAASGGWRVQLGAFREEPRARALWDSVKARVSGLGAYQPYLVRGGDVTRLQAGPLRTAADADRLCGQLKSSGYSCIVKEM